MFLKVVSTEAYQAFTPVNLLKVDLLWTRPPPLGVRTIPRQEFIEVDEFGVEPNGCNARRGWAIKFLHIRKAGHYSWTQKVTVLIGIEPGDPGLPETFWAVLKILGDGSRLCKEQEQQSKSFDGSKSCYLPQILNRQTSSLFLE
jgi:hypothetical protein